MPELSGIDVVGAEAMSRSDSARKWVWDNMPDARMGAYGNPDHHVFACPFAISAYLFTLHAEGRSGVTLDKVSKHHDGLHRLYGQECRPL